MNAFPQRVQAARRGAGAAAILFMSLGVLGGCSDILDVELPAQLGDEVLESPVGAQSQINSIIGQFENAHNEFLIETWGREAFGETPTSHSQSRTSAYYTRVYAAASFSGNYFAPMMKARRFAFGLHEKLQNEWTVAEVPQRAQFLAISSIYGGAVLSWMGSSLCESVIDGPLLTSAQTLALADTWLTQALAEIASAGDFAMPYGASTSAKTMTHGLRAQVRWMAGDTDGARQDAELVPAGFFAYVTRDTDTGRRNLAWEMTTFSINMKLYDVITWWDGPVNPATGLAWANPIPFTGWVNLAILPDGRAVREDGLPIRTKGPHTTADEQANATRDTRVKHFRGKFRTGGDSVDVVDRYAGPDDDIPLVNWKEMVLIRAEIGGGQTAIDLVNELRTADGLPLVTYADPSNAEQIRYMIFEERRRALFAEGRFTYTKFQNPDIMWFPRNDGHLRDLGAAGYEGGVRWLMPYEEYELADGLTLADRATGCPEHQRPVQY